MEFVSTLDILTKGLGLALANPKITHIVRARPDLEIEGRLPGMAKKRLVIAKRANQLGLGIGEHLHIGPSFAHVPIMSTLKNLPELFQRTGGILCPHLLMEAALRAGRVPFVQKKI